MICEHCKTDAVGCLTCGKTVSVRGDGLLRKHKRQGRYARWCTNHRPGRHPECVGCTCQHKPKGAWNGNK